jgi:ATP phosphoribosyltransferase
MGLLKEIVLAIPNGSLQKATLKMLNKSCVDLEIVDRRSQFIVPLENLTLVIRIMRPQSIPVTVFKGKADIGITGWDCIVEEKLDKKLLVITELPYSKNTSGPVKIVAYCRKGSKVDKEKIVDTKSITVFSEYPKITRRLFKKAKIIFSHGSTEAEIAAGTYDYGVGVSESGQSLRDNNLKIVHTFFHSPTVLIAKKDKEEYKTLGELFLGALEAREYQVLKMNVPGKKIEEILKFLPSLRAPTVHPIVNSDEEWHSIETVVEKKYIPSLVIKLRRLGVTGIFTQELNILLK